jgi:hypothetical protein
LDNIVEHPSYDLALDKGIVLAINQNFQKLQLENIQEWHSSLNVNFRDNAGRYQTAGMSSGWP